MTYLQLKQLCWIAGVVAVLGFEGIILLAAVGEGNLFAGGVGFFLLFIDALIAGILLHEKPWRIQ